MPDDEITARLRERGSVGTVSDLDDFPFDSYDAFMRSYGAGQVLIGFASGLFSQDFVFFWWTGTRGSRTSLLTILAIPLIFSFGSIWLAVSRHDWMLLLGLAASVVGITSARANLNLIDGCLMFFIAFISILMVHDHPWILILALACCGTSVLISFTLAGMANAYRFAITQSEAALVRLVQRGIVKVNKVPPSENTGDDDTWPPAPTVE